MCANCEHCIGVCVPPVHSRLIKSLGRQLATRGLHHTASDRVAFLPEGLVSHAFTAGPKECQFDPVNLFRPFRTGLPVLLSELEAGHQVPIQLELGFLNPLFRLLSACSVHGVCHGVEVLRHVPIVQDLDSFWEVFLCHAPDPMRSICDYDQLLCALKAPLASQVSHHRIERIDCFQSSYSSAPHDSCVGSVLLPVFKDDPQFRLAIPAPEFSKTSVSLPGVSQRAHRPVEREITSLRVRSGWFAGRTPPSSRFPDPLTHLNCRSFHRGRTDVNPQKPLQPGRDIGKCLSAPEVRQMGPHLTSCIPALLKSQCGVRR